MLNNCINAIAQGPVTNVLDFHDLVALTCPFEGPFQLELLDGSLLVLEKSLRLVPKKRLVAFGQWQGKAIVAKLFFAPWHAKRNMEKDQAGSQTLKEKHIPTPLLYYHGTSRDKRIYVLLFERLFGAMTFEELWRKDPCVQNQLPLLHTVIIELATQHVYGAFQRDLHFKNFLVSKNGVFTLDGASIEAVPQLLPKLASIDNLALFFSQLGAAAHGHHLHLFQFYAKMRGWLLRPQDIAEFFLLIKKWSETRWQKYQKKIFRPCSDFLPIRHAHHVGMVDRHYLGPEWAAFLQDPDAVFNLPTTTLLKSGRSATVAKLVLDNHVLVIKRYNVKGLWHALKRCLRPTRACQSWRFAQKLRLFCLSTARPVAFFEKRYLGLRGKSYYVTEYVPGPHIGEFFRGLSLHNKKATSAIAQITALLKSMAQCGISHGDLKMTNILMDGQNKPIIIDLDGATEHVSLSSLHRAWRKEIKRFLLNFSAWPNLYDAFKTQLKQ